MHDKDLFGDEPHPREPDKSDTDAVWAEIVASFHASPDDALPRWPAAEDVDPDPVDHTADTADGAGSSARMIRPALGDDPLGLFGPGGHADEDRREDQVEEGFVPPPPPPLPRGDPISRAAWSGVLGGPTYLLVAALAGWYVPTWLGSLAVGGFVGGFVTLVARLRGHDPHDPDNGAVV